MLTVTDNLQEMADEIKELLQTLLLDHSSLYKWNIDDGGIRVFSVSGDYAYRDLPDLGRQIQAKVLEMYRRFNALLKTLLREQPSDVLKQLSDAATVMLRTIEQEQTWCKTAQEALAKATKALQTQTSLLKNLYDPSSGDVFYVPDTNALLYNPILEKWYFEGVPAFALVFTPTILSELDALKTNHRNQNVRKKAETLIKQIKEFRRRGRLAEGVPLVKGKSTVWAVAVEPNMQDSLPWLDSTNNDDRFLAAVIELMRLRPRSAVFAVSRDINFQNKAEFARIPFVEPPEPMTVTRRHASSEEKERA
jgi:hypothetical protein